MESSWALLCGLGVLLEGSVLWVSLGIPSSPVQGFRGSRVRVGRESPRPIPGSARYRMGGLRKASSWLDAVAIWLFFAGASNWRMFGKYLTLTGICFWIVN